MVKITLFQKWIISKVVILDKAEVNLKKQKPNSEEYLLYK